MFVAFLYSLSIISYQDTCFGLLKEMSQYVLRVNIENNYFWGHILSNIKLPLIRTTDNLKKTSGLDDYELTRFDCMLTHQYYSIIADLPALHLPANLVFNVWVSSTLNFFSLANASDCKITKKTHKIYEV